MSFSSDVKDELSEEKNIPSARHCQLAELCAIVLMEGQLSVRDGHTYLGLATENEKLRNLFFTLLKRTGTISFIENDPSDDVARDILMSLKMTDESDESVPSFDRADGVILQQPCCRKAFLRGAFLCSGSVSNPRKAYHLEIVCRRVSLAQQLCELMRSMDLDAKIVRRKEHEVVYLKEGSQIEDLIGIMGASKAYMDYENVRIMKEMRNGINRQVNCETANIGKTISASVRQQEDVELISRSIGLGSLPDSLRETAVARIKHPDLSLKDLGAMLHPPVGKSGVNHRLRRISDIADRIRNEKE